MIRAFFGCYGNQIKVNALVEYCASFSEYFDTKIRQIDQWVTELGQMLQKKLHKTKWWPVKVKFSSSTNFNETCLKLFPMIVPLKKVYRHVLPKLHV